MMLPRGTVAEQVLPYTLQSQGWALSVNGVAASCIRRSLETGDVIFLSRPNKPVPGFHLGHAVLFMPHLRALTLPISLVDARPVPQQLTLAQTRDNSAIMRDELTRHINARIHLMGSAGPGLCPVTVMGMHHGPVMLYLPGPEPSLEHVQLVLDSIPEMPAGVQAFPCEAFPGEAPIFVTADPEAGTATAIIASTLGFGLDNLISVPLLPTQQHLGTAVYLAPGYVAEPFARPPNGHYIRRTRVSLPGSGTSLACLDSGPDQTKNARLCSQARAKGIVSPRCPVSAQPQPPPLLPSEGRASIVTPLGRRNLPIPKPVADDDRHIGPDMVQSVKDPVEAAEARDTLSSRPGLTLRLFSWIWRPFLLRLLQRAGMSSSDALLIWSDHGLGFGRQRGGKSQLWDLIPVHGCIIIWTFGGPTTECISSQMVPCSRLMVARSVAGGLSWPSRTRTLGVGLQGDSLAAPYRASLTGRLGPPIPPLMRKLLPAWSPCCGVSVSHRGWRSSCGTIAKVLGRSFAVPVRLRQLLRLSAWPAGFVLLRCLPSKLA